MPLNSAIFKGTVRNARLEQAAVGPPPIKAAPPADDVDAIRRIQRALVALGHPIPKSFPNGPDKEPDGKYAEEVFKAVLSFQQQVLSLSLGRSFCGFDSPEGRIQNSPGLLALGAQGF